MKKKHLDKIGSMCYIYLLCVSLPVTIMFETTQSIVDPGNFSSFQGVQGNDYVCQRPIFGHEINKFEE